MDATQCDEFEDRLRRIEEARVRDALTRPRNALGARLPRPWRRIEIGLKLAGMAAVSVIVLKGALLLDIGPDAYDQHRAELATGTMLDQFAALLMRPDPVTMVLRATAGDAVTAAVAAQTTINAVESTAAAAPSETPTKAPTSLNFNPSASGVMMATARRSGVAAQPPGMTGMTGAGGAILGGITFVHVPVQDGAATGFGGSGQTTRGMAGMFIAAPLPRATATSP
jgi:hypothetical protein